MKNRWLLLAVPVLVVLVLLFDWDTDYTDKDTPSSEQSALPADYPPITLQWLVGVAQQYRIQSDSTMHMQAAPQGASDIRVQLSAQLDSLTLKVDNSEALVGMRFSSAQLEINDTVDTETNRALTTPFRVLFSTNGTPLTFEFPAGVDTQNRTILENLIRTFQVSLTSDDEWTVSESNGMGTYEASYKRTGAEQFEKSKHTFKTTADGMVSWSKIESTENFRIEAGHNWITEMTIQESMHSEDEGTPQITVDNHATLKRQHGVQLSLSPTLWDFDAVSAEKTENYSVKKVPKITAIEARKQILVTIPKLNDATQGRLSHIYQLRDLLRVDASLPAIILDALKTQDLSDRTRADLYLVLELAGTDSAQDALVEVITDNSWSLKDGMRAIVAMGGVKQPNTESITALWDMAQYGSGGERQRMADSATFALGSVGNTMNKVDNPEYEALRSSLLSNALGGGDINQRSNYITALGNTHDTTLANDVVILMDDTEPAIRRAAALSLGSLGTDQVADRLVSHYNEEDNGYVRGAIAESLQSWTEPSDSAMEMFRQTVRTEKDESTRYNIAILLSENLDKFPNNEPVLREIMRSEPSKRIRQKVAEALSTHQSQR